MLVEYQFVITYQLFHELLAGIWALQQQHEWLHERIFVETHLKYKHLYKGSCSPLGTISGWELRFKGPTEIQSSLHLRTEYSQNK
jgi:hypothetical protein